METSIVQCGEASNNQRKEKQNQNLETKLRSKAEIYTA